MIPATSPDAIYHTICIAAGPRWPARRRPVAISSALARVGLVNPKRGEIAKPQLLANWRGQRRARLQPEAAFGHDNQGRRAGAIQDLADHL